jgi:hypothetical protein
MFVTMAVNGTVGPDVITLLVSSGFVTATVNGTPQVAPDVTVTDIVIDARGGADRIDIQSTGTNAVVVHAGAGNDAINLAPNSGELESIAGAVTINGDADADSLTFFDVNETSNSLFIVTSSSVDRNVVPTVNFGTLESVVIEAGSANDVLRVNSLGTTLTFNGGAQGPGVGDEIQLIGAGAAIAGYTPSAATPGNGSMTFGLETLNFTGCERGNLDQMFGAVVTTPSASDAINISAPTPTQNIVSGTSGGVSFMPVIIGAVNILHLNLAANDSGGGIDTVFAGTGGIVGASTLRIEAGAGDNTATFNGGPVALDTSFGPLDGTNLDVELDNGAVVTFADDQVLRGLRIEGNSEAKFNGTATVLTVQNLSVGPGANNILRLNSGQVASNTTTFSIAANATLNKLGGGTMGISAAQSHGVDSSLIYNGGALNMTTDAGGSAAARRLSVHAAGSTVNFFSSQHLDTVSTGIAGLINLQPNGNRVLVCNDVFIETEGSAINLTDNDMIFEYSGATPIENIRLLLRNGFANGAWNGIGINSSTAAATGINALGYAEATDLFSTFPATFAGEQVDSTAILIKYTFYGDFDLNGQVNLTDFNRLAANFGLNNKRWVGGDADYNLLVNLADFNRLAGAFGQSGLGANPDADDDADQTFVDDVPGQD